MCSRTNPTLDSINLFLNKETEKDAMKISRTRVRRNDAK